MWLKQCFEMFVEILVGNVSPWPCQTPFWNGRLSIIGCRVLLQDAKYAFPKLHNKPVTNDHNSSCFSLQVEVPCQKQPKGQTSVWFPIYGSVFKYCSPQYSNCLSVRYLEEPKDWPNRTQYGMFLNDQLFTSCSFIVIHTKSGTSFMCSLK